MKECQGGERRVTHSWDPKEPRAPHRAVLRVVMIDLTSPRMYEEHLGVRVEPTRRLVSIELTEEQRRQLAAQWTGYVSGVDEFEQVGLTFLEMESTAQWDLRC